MSLQVPVLALGFESSPCLLNHPTSTCPHQPLYLLPLASHNLSGGFFTLTPDQRTCRARRPQYHPSIHQHQPQRLRFGRKKNSLKGVTFKKRCFNLETTKRDNCGEMPRVLITWYICMQRKLEPAIAPHCKVSIYSNKPPTLPIPDRPRRLAIAYAIPGSTPDVSTGL